MDQSVYVSVRTVSVLGVLGWINTQLHTQATCKQSSVHAQHIIDRKDCVQKIDMLQSDSQNV